MHRAGKYAGATGWLAWALPVRRGDPGGDRARNRAQEVQFLEYAGKRHDARVAGEAGRTVAAAASADQQHELSAHLALLAHPVRLGGRREREGPRDRERESPGLDQLADLGERVDRGRRPRC